MFCPKCKLAITEATLNCRLCGFKFGTGIQKKLDLYFILKNELENLTSSGKQLQLQIQSLSAKIVAYQKEIDGEILAIVLESTKGPIEIEKPIPADKTTQQTEAPAQTSPPLPEVSLTLKPSEKPPEIVSTQKSYRSSIGSEFRFGQKWLLIIGIITVIFGVAFFLKYSFERGWVGPAGRVSLAYLWGLAFLVTGHFLRKKQLHWFGLAIYGGGIAILYFATYAAFHIYHLLPQSVSFSIMVLITILACAMAVVYEAQALAVVGLVGGFSTPMLMSTGQDNYIFLFTYMTILNVGILGISFRKRWAVLQVLGFVVTYLIYTLWHADRYGPQKFWAAFLFVNISYIIYSIAPFAYYFLRKQATRLSGFHILIPNSIFALSFNYLMIKEKYTIEWMSVVTVFYAILFLIFAYQLSRQGESSRNALVVMLLKSMLFLALTIPLLFSQHWITIFWALLSILLFIGGQKLGEKNLVFCAIGIYFVALFKFLFYDLSFVFQYNMDATTLHIRRSYDYLMFERWFTMAIILVVPYLMRRITVREIKLSSTAFSSPSIIQIPAVTLGIFGTLLFLLFTMETSAFFYKYLPQARFASISVIWAIFSIVLMVFGFQKNRDRMRKIALGLLFLTTFKVFLFDIRNISTPYRILSFIVLGLILILISYLYNQAKGRLLNIEGKKQE